MHSRSEKPRQKRSLKTKLSLWGSFLFLTSAAIIASFALSYVDRELKNFVRNQQYALASSIGGDLDDKLRMAKAALHSATLQVTPDMLADPEKMQAFLDTKCPLQSMFTNRIFIVDATGTVLAETPYTDNRRGTNIAFREYFQRTMRSGQAVVSKPYYSMLPGHSPSVALSSPIIDSGGKMIGMLVGGINLYGENFLGDLPKMKIGAGGYVCVFTRGGIILVHPDKARIMKPFPRGINQMLDSALDGYDGTGETVDSRGAGQLSAAKQLEDADWILMVNFPTSEAYQILYRTRTYLIAGIALASLLMLCFFWLVTARLTRPLVAFTSEVQAMTEGQALAPLRYNPSCREIDALGAAFQRLVTMLQAQTQSLQEEEERHRLILEHAPDAILVCSKGICRYANAGAVNLLGAAGKEDLVGKPVPIPTCLDEDQDAEVGITRHDETLTRPDGSTLEAEVTEIIFNYQGSVGVQIVLRDISAQRLLDRRLQQYRDELEQKVAERTRELQQSLKELETFSYTVAHDLRTPLRGINGYSSIILESAEDRLSEDEKEIMHRLINASSRMGQLVNDLLDLARLSRVEMALEQVDLSQMVADCCEEQQRQESERPVQLAILPGILALADRQLLRTVVENLVQNAWKFTRHAPQPRVEFFTAEQEGETVYCFRDNGAGFEMSHAELLFKPFQRLVGQNEYPGTGIGLASIKRIIDRHHGSVWAQGNPGGGATFFFTLPGSPSVVLVQTPSGYAAQIDLPKSTS